MALGRIKRCQIDWFSSIAEPYLTFNYSQGNSINVSVKLWEVVMMISVKIVGNDQSTLVPCPSEYPSISDGARGNYGNCILW